MQFSFGRRVGPLILAAMLFLLLVPSAMAAQDSKGTDFWLAFPGNLGVDALSLFITGDVATTGTVEIPGLSFSTAFTVTPGSVTTVSIPTTAEIQTSDVVENKGIRVTAGAEVTVYALNRRQFTTDAYLGLPVDILGTEYIALGHENVNIVNANQFTLIGTQAATTVTITPKVTVGARTAGVPYNITLNQGQTYQLRDTNAAPSDLSGTIITSDKPIGVYGGHQCANIPDGNTFACDHIVEQLSPTSTWGKSFVTMPLATRLGGDTFRFLASTDGTTVSLNGSPIASLNRGQVHEQIVTGPAHITANNPILVAQYSNGSTFDGVTSDPFMMLIPPFEQFLGNYTVTTPATGFNPNFINIVAPNAAVGAISVDGVPIPASDYVAIGSSGFSGTQKSVGLGTHNLSGPLPFGAFMYGFADFDSYGYPGGMALGEVARVTSLTLAPKTATNPVGTQHCVTGTVKDQNGNPLAGIRVDFEVTGANPTTGFQSTDANGQAQFCYTGTNGGTDSIEASVGTLSDTASKTWTTQSDTTSPSCLGPFVGTDSQGRKFIEVKIQDAGSGMGTVEVTELTNAEFSLTPPPTSSVGNVHTYSPPTTAEIVARATKINQKLSSRLALKLTDASGNVTTCDPVLTLSIRENGKPVTATESGLPQAESKVTVRNGTPGLTSLEVKVNGKVFQVAGLKNGEERTIDVASAMLAGNDNTITLTALGRPGGSAEILISDIAPAQTDTRGSGGLPQHQGVPAGSMDGRDVTGAKRR